MTYIQYAEPGTKIKDSSTPQLTWPLIDGQLVTSDTTRLGPEGQLATYINEKYQNDNGDKISVVKALYPDGYRDISIGEFIRGYRPDGSINYTITPEEYEEWYKEQAVPKGFDGMKVKRVVNFFNPFTWPARIAATLSKDAPEGTEFPAIVVDKKRQTLGRCDSHGCVRVENKKLDELYNQVQPGTNVYIRKKGGNMKLIPKGAKGWYASEMKTWSPEKINQILLKYGKDGLTLNTYNYLIQRAAQQNKPTSLVLTAILQTKDLNNLPTGGLMFLATSIGVPNAYDMKSNEQLQDAISKLETINNRKAAELSKKQMQQSLLEDIWARKNYKAMTGKDWHAGVDLSNYTMSAIKKLQKEIGTTVDGKWGVESQQAYDIYLKKQNPEPRSSTSVSTQNTVKVTNPSQQTNYWELVKNDPEFAQWLYTSGGTGSGRRLANKVNVAGNYIAGMINPDGVTPFNIGQGLQRQAVGAALYNIQNGKSGVTDSAHYALGGLGTNKHSGTEFRQDNVDKSGKQRSLWETVKVYADKAANAPYHYVYGESSDTRFESDGFHSEGDGYTFNNVWDGGKFVKELADGQGDSSTGFLTGMTNVVRGILSGGNPLAVMETQAANRGVNTQRNKKVKFVPQEILEDWAKEYYLAHNSSNNGVVKSLFGGRLNYYNYSK